MIHSLEDIKKKSYWVIDIPNNNKQEELIKRFILEGIFVNIHFDKFSNILKNEINIDDIIALKSRIVLKDEKGNFNTVNRIKAIGTVVRNFKDGRFLEIRWNSENKPYDVNINLPNDDIYKVDDIGKIIKIFYPNQNIPSDVKTLEEIYENQKSNFSLNQIFWGPSGSGKTYNSIITAIQIVNGFYTEDKKDLKKILKNYIENNQIKFLTFHKNFKYEDFIEGIKTILDKETGKLIKIVKDGILKDLSKLAYSELQKKNSNYIFNFDKTKNKIFKMSIGTKSLEKDDLTLSYCFEKNYIALDILSNIDYSIIENTEDWDKAREELSRFYQYEENVDQDKKRLEIQSIYFFKNYMKSDDIVLVSNDNEKIIGIAKVNGWYEFKDIVGIRFNHFRKVDWIVKNCNIPVELFYKRKFSSHNIYELDILSFNLENFHDFLNNKSIKSYVLIIDEINNSDIYDIFGDVITIIDEEKRLGNSQELKVKLPYSNEDFGIPKNLYLIASINSFDGIDVNLMRKFDFIKTDINYKLLDFSIDNINVSKLLFAINKRISYLIGENYQIGQGYFSKLVENPSFETLREIFKKKIIPFLINVFDNDLKKVSIVLGDLKKDKDELKFIIQEKIDTKALFGKNINVQNKNLKINIPNTNIAFIGIYDEI